MTRNLLVGMFSLALLAGWTASSDRTPSPAEPGATIQRTSSDDGDPRKICVCYPVAGRLYCFGNTCK